jgi:hypothetical protein
MSSLDNKLRERGNNVALEPGDTTYPKAARCQTKTVGDDLSDAPAGV